MLQIPVQAKGVQITAAGANENLRFPDTPCVAVLISANSANAGNVFIGGMNGTTPDTYGYKLAAGVGLPLIWIDNLKKLSYKIENSGEKINVLVLS